MVEESLWLAAFSYRGVYAAAPTWMAATSALLSG